MSDRLSQLAERVARQLAAQDLASKKPSVGAGATGQAGVSTASSVTAVASSTPSTAASSQGIAPAGVTFVRENARIADFIDHTLLKAEATRADIDTLCDEAREHHFATVCVNPVWVRRCVERLAGSEVGIATVVGFPLGASATESKRAEAALAVRDGATEIDMVAAIGHIKCGDWRHVGDDIAAVVAGAGGRLVKVIIESAALTPVEIIKASALAKECGAHYVKTSTGFHAAGGASVEAVALMRLVVGDALGVKASGGVRDCASALRMLANGATRIGTSSGVAMAKCLGAGPRPWRELLSMADAHEGACGCGACSATENASGAGKAY
ncbi:MAG: deoxyribose-phosphate aldolase [Gemmatimonadaceae bacterium]